MRRLPLLVALVLAVGCRPAARVEAPPGVEAPPRVEAPPSGPEEPRLQADARGETPEDGLAAVLEEADVVVHGRVISHRPGDVSHLHELARLHRFELFLPRYAYPRVDMEVLASLRGGEQPGRLFFYRASDLTFATEDIEAHSSRILGEEGLFILRRSPSGAFLWATDRHAHQPPERLAEIRERLAGHPSEPRGAPPGEPIPTDASSLSLAELRDLLVARGAEAVPLLRRAIAEGSPTRRYLAIRMVQDYGVLHLVPDLIALMTDETRVPADGDHLRGRICEAAAWNVARMAWMLDDVDLPERVDATYLRSPGSEARARRFWETWWQTYRDEGPVESARLRARQIRSPRSPTGVDQIADPPPGLMIGNLSPPLHDNLA